MALRVWLPLNGSLENKGLSSTDFGTSTAFASTGRIGAQSAYSNMQKTITCSELTGVTEFSLAYWLKVDSSIAITNWSDIIGLECTVGSNSAIIRDEFTNAVGLHQIIVGKDTSVGSNTYNYYGAGIWTSTAKDVWAHFTIAKNATNTYVYVNGVLTVTLTNSNFESSPQQLTGKIYLGNSSSTAAQFNDLRIYDHCLSAKEVKEIAQGLVLHYKLNGWSGGSGKNIALKSNNGNFGSTDELKTITFTGWDNYAQYNLNLTADEWNSLVGKKVTYTCYINNIEQTVGTGTGIMIHFRYADGTYTQYGGGKNGTSGSYFAQGESGLAKLTVTVPDPTTRTNPTTITHVQYSVRHNSSTGAGTVEYQHAQVEIGDTPTAWSWAPEDLGIDTTKVTDSSGYGNDGTIIGTLTTSNNDNNGRYNVSSYISTGNNNYITTPSLTLSGNNLTMSIWFKTSNTSPTNGYHSIFCSHDRCYYELSCTAAGAARIGAYINGTRYVANGGSGVTDGNWHMLSFTYDGSIFKRYLDGTLYNSTSISGTLNGTQEIMYIGRLGSDAGYRVENGYLADARIYATALSADDVLDLYHTSANIDNLGGVHSFEFKEVETENLSDFSLVASNWVADGVTATYTPEDDIVKMAPSSGNKRIYHNVVNLWTSGKTYLVSLWAKADSSGAVIRPSRSIADFATPNFNLTTDWKQYYGIINCTSTVTNGTLSISYSGSTNIACYVSHIKLEEANKNLDSVMQTGVFKENWIDETNFTTNAKILKNESVVIGREFIEK